MLEPKSRNVEPEVLMESLFKLSDLETRFPVNLNVLDARGTPGVMGLKAALQAFLDHRREVLVRRARHRLGKIEARLHILDGLLIVYLNLDEVIRIVRYEEEPKARLIETFDAHRHPGRRHPQHPPAPAGPAGGDGAAPRARRPRRGARRHRRHAGLRQARSGSWWAWACAHVRKILGPDTDARQAPLDLRRRARVDAEAAIEAMIAREPITVILSDRGWIRAAKGRVEDPSELKFKEGDKLAFLVPAETTDKLLIFASDGRFFTLACDKLPRRARPRRAAAPDDRPRRPGRHRRRLRPQARRASASWPSKAGYGFILPEDEAIAFRRAGKQVLNVDAEGAACLPAEATATTSPSSATTARS